MEKDPDITNPRYSEHKSLALRYIEVSLYVLPGTMRIEGKASNERALFVPPFVELTICKASLFGYMRDIHVSIRELIQSGVKVKSRYNA